MTHGILIPNQIAATNIDSYNRSAVYASSTVDNGNIVMLTTYGALTGQAEVFTAVPASTAAGLTDVWMVYEPELVWTSNYRGIDVDVRNFDVPATKIFSVFKPQLHDIFTLSTDGISGTIGVNTFINAGDTGKLQPEWVPTATTNGTVFAAKLLATTYISVGMGSIDSNRVVAYKFEVVAL